MRILTYNIRGTLGMDDRRSVERIAEVVRAADLDVACLQEVHRRLPWGAMEDQPARLARLTGLSPVFQNNLRVKPGQYGNLILSRWPVRDHHSLALANGGEIQGNPGLGVERRGLLDALIETPDGPFAALTCHWSLNAEDRQGAARVVAERVRQLDVPLALTGDLNAQRESEEIRLLADLTGLLDAGAVAGPTFPSDVPRSRIDYVWLSPGLTPTRIEVLDTQASDHRPLLVEW